MYNQLGFNIKTFSIFDFIIIIQEAWYKKAKNEKIKINILKLSKLPNSIMDSMTVNAISTPPIFGVPFLFLCSLSRYLLIFSLDLIFNKNWIKLFPIVKINIKENAPPINDRKVIYWNIGNIYYKHI